MVWNAPVCKCSCVLATAGGNPPSAAAYGSKEGLGRQHALVKLPTHVNRLTVVYYSRDVV